jgi:hypothetical protein
MGMATRSATAEPRDARSLAVDNLADEIRANILTALGLSAARFDGFIGGARSGRW